MLTILNAAGFHRTPAVAVALAEMYFQVVESQPSKTSSRKRKHAATQTKHEQLLHSCTVNVGMFEAAFHMMQSAQSSAGTTEQADDTSSPHPQQHTASRASGLQQASLAALLVRYHWLGGCISEHLQHHEDAAQQFEVCRSALTALPVSTPDADVCPSGQAPITTTMVDSRLARLNMINIIEEGRRSIEHGQQAQLIARMLPMLLGDTNDEIQLEVPQQLAGLELLQVKRKAKLRATACVSG